MGTANSVQKNWHSVTLSVESHPASKTQNRKPSSTFPTRPAKKLKRTPGVQSVAPRQKNEDAALIKTLPETVMLPAEPALPTELRTNGVTFELAVPPLPDTPAANELAPAVDVAVFTASDVTVRVVPSVTEPSM